MLTDSMSLKVLIVEDDTALLKLMSEVFTLANVDVRPVNDSQDAAALVDAERFDGIFLDLQMPKMDGFELAQHIRRSSWNRSTPIIVVTGGDGGKIMQRVFDAGATFFLQKPIDRHRLLRLLRITQGTMANNRRKSIRVPLEILVSCESRSTEKGMSWDISEGGILLDGPHLHLGDHVKLSFQLPGTQVMVSAIGTVVRRDEQQRAGVRFVYINEAGRSAIREFVYQGGM
jgi:CheY-like chemotaxis protein